MESALPMTTNDSPSSFTVLAVSGGGTRHGVASCPLSFPNNLITYRAAAFHLRRDTDAKPIPRALADTAVSSPRAGSAGPA